jgi:hypothetical protein
MITGLITLLGSSAFSSLIGGIFAWLNRKSDLEVRRLELDHETNRWSHELQLRNADLEQIKAEAQGRREIAVIEGDASMEAARLSAIAASQAVDNLSVDLVKESGSMGWLLILADVMRRVIRPLSTVILLSFALYINILLVQYFLDQGWESMTSAQKFDMALQALTWVGSQASAALGYWFVSRGSSRSC